jgi:hypothetical protein
MEYLEGETLDRRLSKGPLPADQVVRYAIEIADALDKAHRQGIIHRDLKPVAGERRRAWRIRLLCTTAAVLLFLVGMAAAVAYLSHTKTDHYSVRRFVLPPEKTSFQSVSVVLILGSMSFIPSPLVSVV